LRAAADIVHFFGTAMAFIDLPFSQT
jgi:hypothetical protein